MGEQIETLMANDQIFLSKMLYKLETTVRMVALLQFQEFHIVGSSRLMQQEMNDL